jgi:phage gp46-like protein
MLSSQAVSATLYRLADWFKPEDKRPAKIGNVAHQYAPAAIFPLVRAPSPGAAHVRASRANQSRRPLRVVRVIDADPARSNTGRIVISGCMADVCAELDRMVQRESAAA